MNKKKRKRKKKKKKKKKKTHTTDNPHRRNHIPFAEFQIIT